MSQKILRMIFHCPLQCDPPGRSANSLGLGSAQGPDSLITIPLPLGPAWPQAPVSSLAAQSFHSFSNQSGQAFQILAQAAEEEVGWRMWVLSMPNPVSPWSSIKEWIEEVTFSFLLPTVVNSIGPRGDKRTRKKSLPCPPPPTRWINLL